MERSGGRHQREEAEARRSRKLRVSRSAGVPGLARHLRGRVFDLRSVALDDQAGKLHVPVLERTPAPVRPGRTVTGARRRHVTRGELVVSRVVELSVVEPGPTRLFELDGLVYDADRRSLAIVSKGSFRLLLSVERLDLELRLQDPEITLP